MTLLNTLTKEHRLFEQLIERLQNALTLEDRLARSEIRDTLHILLPAMDRHEEMEHLLFNGRAAGSAAAEVELQHQAIAALRQGVLDGLQAHDECPFPTLTGRLADLLGKLRQQFVTEETKLWPEYRGARNAGLDRSAKAQMAVMEREMQGHWSMISEYLGRGR